MRTLAEGGSTFTSLVPTHYIMMLGLPDGDAHGYNVDAVDKLMISSAPARATPSSQSWIISGTQVCSSSTARPKPVG